MKTPADTYADDDQDHGPDLPSQKKGLSDQNQRKQCVADQNIQLRGLKEVRMDALLSFSFLLVHTFCLYPLPVFVIVLSAISDHCI